MSRVALGKAAKGLYAAAITVLGTLTTILVGPAGFGSITAGQWVAVALFGLGALGGAFGLAGWEGPTVGKPPGPGA